MTVLNPIDGHDCPDLASTATHTWPGVSLRSRLVVERRSRDEDEDQTVRPCLAPHRRHRSGRRGMRALLGAPRRLGRGLPARGRGVHRGREGEPVWYVQHGAPLSRVHARQGLEAGRGLRRRQQPVQGAGGRRRLPPAAVADEREALLPDPMTKAVVAVALLILTGCSTNLKATPLKEQSASQVDSDRKRCDEWSKRTTAPRTGYAACLVAAGYETTPEVGSTSQTIRLAR